MKKQVNVERDIRKLLQARRSKVNKRKLKLIWKGREKLPEKFLFESVLHRERFYEAIFSVRADPSVIHPSPALYGLT